MSFSGWFRILAKVYDKLSSYTLIWLKDNVYFASKLHKNITEYAENKFLHGVKHSQLYVCISCRIVPRQLLNIVAKVLAVVLHSKPKLTACSQKWDKEEDDQREVFLALPGNCCWQSSTDSWSHSLLFYYSLCGASRFQSSSLIYRCYGCFHVSNSYLSSWFSPAGKPK